MSAANESFPDFSSLERGRFSYLPVVPGRLEFAIEVRRRILGQRPAIVAVELPETLEQPYLDAIQRLPQISVIFYNDPVTRSRSSLSDPSRGSSQNDDQPDQAVYVPVEPADPFIEAIRSAQEIGAQVVFADPDTNERPHLPDSYPDSWALQSIPLSQYVEAYRVYPQERTPELESFAEGIAWKLQGADPLAHVLVVLSLNLLDPVLDAMEKPAPEPARRRRENLQLVNAHPECLGEIASEYPFLQERYEMFRVEMRERGIVDRPRVQFVLFREAEHAWVLNTGEKMHAWQRRMLARYSRNLALIHHDLTASLFDLTIAARSIVDENYAWDVWETASRYSHQQTASDLETVKISGDEVWLHTRRVRLRRRLPSAKRRLGNVGLKPRKKEKFPGEWASELNGASICSYPPEDMIIEDFGRFLKKKGKSVLSEERASVEPFTASLLDGIDLRETIRNWHEKKIFVRNVQKIHGEVGSVIVIFDEDSTLGEDLSGRYGYMTTWLGEHQNESDMAFYSTHPFEHLIGPGIGRAEYGGFLMSLPARRMYDVWADPDYDFAETKAERLLLAGLDYSIQKYVVYVAAKPPRSVFRNIAARFGRTIVYIPIGQLSPVTMKKIRVVHVLDGYDKRDGAREFDLVEIRRLNGVEMRDHLAGLAAVLVDCVDGGASVSFMAPFGQPDGEAFFSAVGVDVEAEKRILLAAFVDGKVVGTVQVVMTHPPNQPHRADVAKLLVHRSARGQGIARQLMERAERAAAAAGKTLLVLDTVTGGAAERLYERLNWVKVGVIPNFALFPDGRLTATTIFFKELVPVTLEGE